MAKKKQVTTVTEIADVLKLFSDGTAKREEAIQINDYVIDLAPTSKYVRLDLDTVVTENHDIDITFNNVNFKFVDEIRAPSAANLNFKNCTFSPRIVIDAGQVVMDRCKVNSLTIRSDFRAVVIRNSKAGSLNSINICKARTVSMVSCKNIGTLQASVITGTFELRNVTMTDMAIDNCSFNRFLMYDSKCSKTRFRYSTVSTVTIAGSKIDETLYALNTLIYGKLDVRSSEIRTLEFSQAAVFGDFIYEPENIEHIETHTSVGLKPPENEFIMYKSCDVRNLSDDCLDRVIVQLSVPANADRVYCGELKIRVSEAKVMKFLKLDGTPFKPARYQNVCSSHDHKFIYKIGKTVKPVFEFYKTSGKCGSGIHGFIKFVDAVNYS